jgi:nucleotide-binding universal stress UspA family protein
MPLLWEVIMSYVTLMVHLDLDQENDARLSVVGDLAERFTARVIGVAAQAKPVYYTDDLDGARFVEADRGAMEDNLAEIRQRLQQAEERFRTALRGRAKQLEWRSSIEDPIPYIADQCRVADLLVIGKTASDEMQEPNAQINPIDLIARTGRPLLLVPLHVQTLLAQRIVVGWKDTREARRAVLDALPLLKKSQHVIVCKIDEDHDPGAAQRHVDDVVTWLANHGVSGVGMVEPLRDSPAIQLEALARQEAADLIVAGAFGHSKLREWIFGGVTRDLLAQSSCCQLLAH